MLFDLLKKCDCLIFRTTDWRSEDGLHSNCPVVVDCLPTNVRMKLQLDLIRFNLGEKLPATEMTPGKGD